VIILSGILVVLAIALLVAGIVAGADGVGGVQGLTLIYVSIAISIVSALCLAIGVFLRRKELFGANGAAPARPVKPVKGGKPGKAARKAKGAKEAVVQTPDDPAEETVVLSSQPLAVPADATVFVVRGRKRYHLENCRQLTGRDKEDLTYAEALEEGFSPCTACMPDTALAARAAMSSGEPTAQQATANRSAAGRAGGLGRGTRTESTAAGPAATAHSANAAARSSTQSTPSTAAPDDPFEADRPSSGGFGASDREPRPGTSVVPPPASPAPWESEREQGTPSWAQSRSTESSEIGRFETNRPKRLPEPPDDEPDTAVLGVIAPDDTTHHSTQDESTQDESTQDESTQDGGKRDDSVLGGDGLQRPWSAVRTTSPVAPSALDLSTESETPSVTLKFTATEPKPVQPPGAADAKAAEDSGAGEGEARSAEDLVPGSAPSHSSDPLGDDTAEIARAEEAIGFTGSDADPDATEVDPDATEGGSDSPEGGSDADEAAAETGPTADGVDRPASPQVRILSGTRRYHRPDCALIEDIGDEAEDLESLSRDEAKERGCTPCLVCQPDKEHAAD
jgi:hypothetical protein